MPAAPKNLGDLSEVPLKQVWEHEARDFTPWLRDHIEVLGKALGMDLGLVESEVSVGKFSADLVARDDSAGLVVVIENQLQPSDHGHLGQLLTYGAGVEANSFVWVTPELQEPHRAALDWLNANSGVELNFFGVELRLISVDGSNPAPDLKVVVSPNNWRRGKRPRVGREGKKASAYWEFYEEVLQTFKTRFPGETNRSKTTPDNWLSMGIGKTGFGTAWSFFRRGFRIELYVDTGELETNDNYYELLSDRQTEIDDAMGSPLSWEPLEGKKGFRIALLYPGNPIEVTDDPKEVDKLKAWAIREMAKFRDAWRPFLAGLP